MKAKKNITLDLEEKLVRGVMESQTNSSLIPSIFHEIYVTYYSHEEGNGGIRPSCMTRILLIRLLNKRILQLPAREERLVQIIHQEEEFFFDRRNEEEVNEKIVCGQLLYLLILSFPHRPNLWRDYVAKLIERIESPKPLHHHIFAFERCLFAPKSVKHPHLISLSMDRMSRSISQGISSRDLRIHLTRSFMLSIHQHFQPYLNQVTPYLFPQDYNNRWGEKLVEYIVTQAQVYHFCSSSVLRKIILRFQEFPNENILRVLSLLLPHHVPDVKERENEICNRLIHTLIEKIFQSNQRLLEMFSHSQEKRSDLHDDNNNNNNNSKHPILNPVILLKTIMDCLFCGFRRSSTHQSIYLPQFVRSLRMIKSGQLFSTPLADTIALRNFSTRCLQRLHGILHPLSHPLFVPLDQSEVEQIFKPEWSEIPMTIQEEELELDKNNNRFHELLPPFEEEEKKVEEEKVEEIQPPPLLLEEEEEENKQIIGVKRKSSTDIEKFREENQEQVVILKKRKLDNDVVVTPETKKNQKEEEEEMKSSSVEEEEEDISNLVNFDVMGDDEDFEKLDEIDFD